MNESVCYGAFVGIRERIKKKCGAWGKEDLDQDSQVPEGKSGIWEVAKIVD